MEIVIIISCIAAITIIVLRIMIINAIFKIKNATERTVEEVRIMQENQVKIYRKIKEIEENEKSPQNKT